MLPLVFTITLLPRDCPRTAAPPSTRTNPSFPVLRETRACWERLPWKRLICGRGPPWGCLPDGGDLVPPPVVDGLSGDDVGLAAAQLVAAHRGGARQRGETPAGGGRDALT